MKTDPRPQELIAVGALTLTVPAAYHGMTVVGIEGGTVKRAGTLLAAGAVLAAGNPLTFAPDTPGGTTTLSGELAAQEFSGEYGDLDSPPDLAALEERLSSLEQGAGEAGGSSETRLSGGAQIAAQLDPAATALGQHDVFTLELEWTNTSTLVGGLRIYGANLLPADVGDAILFYGGFSGRELLAEITVTSRASASWGHITELAFAAPMVVASGRIRLTIEASGRSKFRTAAGAPTLTSGTQLRLADTNGAALNASLSAEVFSPGAAVLGVLPPDALPVVLAPSPVDRNSEEETRSFQPGLEIVWPAGGAPYLHVFRPRRRIGDAQLPGESFHLPLTPGLPQ